MKKRNAFMLGLKERIIFRLRHEIFNLYKIGTLYWKYAGMHIGRKTFLSRISSNWPHQVSIGNNCKIMRGTIFHYDGLYKQEPSILVGDNVFIGHNCLFNIRKKITIGNCCKIAAGCKFIDHDHDTSGELPLQKKISTRR